jgi:hypothetical protein
MVHSPDGIVVHSVRNLAGTHYLGFIQTQTCDIESLSESELYLHVASFLTLLGQRLSFNLPQNDCNLESKLRH